MDRRRQTSFANDIGGRIGGLLGQECGGCIRRGPDVLFGNVLARIRQTCRQMAVLEDRVIGEDLERNAVLFQCGDEILGSGKGAVFLNQNAVHIGKPSANWGHVRQCSGKRIRHASNLSVCELVR